MNRSAILETGPPSASPDAPTGREVVAVVLLRNNDMCLLRRSRHVGSDAGCWHCVSGFLDQGNDPWEQVRIELSEEAGVSADDATVLARARLRIDGWIVHTFAIDVSDSSIVLNWEHDDFVWQPFDEELPTPRVPWLQDVLSVLRPVVEKHRTV